MLILVDELWVQRLTSVWVSTIHLGVGVDIMKIRPTILFLASQEWSRPIPCIRDRPTVHPNRFGNDLSDLKAPQPSNCGK